MLAEQSFDKKTEEFLGAVNPTSSSAQIVFAFLFDQFDILNQLGCLLKTQSAHQGGKIIEKASSHLTLQQKMVDRKDRRDLCIFQIGLRFIERCLINAHNFQIPLCSYR
jgi:hypothetical protein